MSCCCHEKKIITTEKAPQAIGPYSVGVSTGCLVFTAGQLGIDPASGDLVEGGVQAQTKQALTNVKAILEAAGSGMEHVVKVTVFLEDMGDFGAMNEVYGTFFGENPPARSAVQAAALPKYAAVEIETIALMPCDCNCDCDE